MGNNNSGERKPTITAPTLASTKADVFTRDDLIAILVRLRGSTTPHHEAKTLSDGDLRARIRKVAHQQGEIHQGEPDY